MEFPKHPTARILQGTPVFLFPFKDGVGGHSVFGFTVDRKIHIVFPDGTFQEMAIFTVVQMECGTCIPLSDIIACIQHKVALN